MPRSSWPHRALLPAFLQHLTPSPLLISPMANKSHHADSDTRCHGPWLYFQERKKKGTCKPFLPLEISWVSPLGGTHTAIYSRSQSPTPSAPLNSPQISPTRLNLKAELSWQSPPAPTSHIHHHAAIPRGPAAGCSHAVRVEMGCPAAAGKASPAGLPGFPSSSVE